MFEIRQRFLTNNDCYKAGKKHTVKGIMWHSTGANNPNLSRYVSPDDGILGVNKNGTDWNRPKPGGRSVCVHAFIGKDKNGVVRTYQTLPWDMVGWHSGKGNKGTANYMGYISFEICEDGLDDPVYFSQAYQQAIELTVYLCKKFNLSEKNVICHCEGYKLGIASNHGDVMHWFSKYNKSMDIVRTEIRMRLRPEQGGFNLMDNINNLKPICKGKLKGTNGLACYSQPSRATKTKTILRKIHEPFNIFARTLNTEEKTDYILVNINPSCIQWVEASGVQLVL